MARRPTKKCDPYGQGGQPLEYADASALLATTLEDGWVLQGRPTSEKREGEQGTASAPPLFLSREYFHPDFLSGSRFLSIVAAVGHNNNHYPKITLERILMKREKGWRVVSTVCCSTETLGGLSRNDFHIAMLVDVEVGRPEFHHLFLKEEESLMKHV